MLTPVKGFEGCASRDSKSGAIIFHGGSAYDQAVKRKEHDKRAKTEIRRLNNIVTSMNNRLNEVNIAFEMLSNKLDEVIYGSK